jgi:DNA adenine methylase
MGGKAIHTKWIMPQLPEVSTFDTFVEVFGGAFWIFTKGFGTKLDNHKVVYNDYDSSLANDWHHIAFERDKLLEECKKLPAHDKDTFMKFKDEILLLEEDGVSIPDLDAAVKHLYLIVQRFVTPGYNLPKPTSGKWERFVLDLERKGNIFDCITNVENMDFQEVIEKYDSPRTLFYADPPYFSTEKYYHQEFPVENHLRLAECLKRIEGKFALSYYSFPDLVEWFPESEYPWHREMKRNMMGAKKGRKMDAVKMKDGGKDVEVLIKNYSANDAISDAKKKLIEF